MSKISIIVPCYNQAQYLDECLQSVLDQTYTDWECIIINDGSPDNTEEVAKRWVEKDKRFHYLYKDNGGVSAARNYGIANASGKWILPLDGDDKIGNEYLSLAEKQFNNEYDIIYCKAVFFGEIDKEWDLPPYDFSEILIKNPFFCSSIFQKKQWSEIGGFDENLTEGFEDWEFWINLLSNSTVRKVKRLDYFGFSYRRKQHSRDVNINKSKEKMSLIYDYIGNKHRKIYNDTFGNTIELCRENRSLKNSLFFQDKKIFQIKKELNKNILTKILYRLILKFS